ncbi:ABC transporter F family member 4 [Pyrus x bretschneideri]|uniref:ABC transporter F family member 4 n=1 Tax=Pyrus x bretschneideri TaxID=225117 RepID=UPI000511A075|nr:ABC transporter F family member 4 [Pyrus x bretschneideri]XP_009373291.1 ABC transporter F family member 4 [Pyrus x bretschneideri]
MEGFGGLGFSDGSNAVRKKRSNTSRRPRNESQLPLDCRDNVSSTPSSEDVSKSDENNDDGSITRKRDINLNLCSARASFSNIMEAETVQNMDKGEGGGSGESEEASNDGSFRGSDEHRHRGIDSKRSSKGALAPANWKGTNKLGPGGVVSDGSENENKVKMVKLKVGGVTRTIQAKSSSGGASTVGPSSVKSSRISDAPRPRQKLILQEDSDDSPSLSSDKGSGLRGVPRKDTSKTVTRVGKAEEPVRKSKRVPKRRVLDTVDDGDDDDMEVRYLEKLKTSKVTSDYTAEYNEDEERKTRKERKISTVMKGSGIGLSVDLGDYGIPRSGKDGKKSRVGSVSDDTDYVEEEEEPVSDSEHITKSKKSRKDFVESSSYNKKEMTVTTRQRALNTGKDVSSSSGAGLFEFPNGLPPAPPRKQKEKPCALEQQIKKTEAAERRRMQVEKATRESEAEAIRKILGQDSSRKKREDKIKKRQEDMAQERAANAFILPPDSVRWVMGPSGSVVTFPNEMGLPAIFDSKPCSYPPPREKCAGPYCTNPYKYRDSQSKLPLCSLRCYKAIHEKMAPLSAC